MTLSSAAPPNAPKVSAVLLAGGASRRFGADNKLLALVGGVPIIAKVAREMLASGIHELIVVTGAERDAYGPVLADLPIKFVHNEAWDAGMGGSIATGVRALSADSEGAFIVPADLATLTAQVPLRLAAVFAEHGETRIVVPVTAGGEQRNPVLWPRRYFPMLSALTGHEGAKSLLASLAAERIDVAFDDELLFGDVDTSSDLERLIAGA